MRPRGRPRLPIDSEQLARFYDEGHTLAQTAAHYGCSVATARNHYRYARPGAPLRSRGTRSFAGSSK